MADTKISALTAASSTDGTEVLPIVQSAATKKMAVSKIKDYIVATANVFTKPQTFKPDSDAQAGTFRRNSGSQTAKIVEIQTESNATLASIDKDGKVAAPELSLGTAGSALGVLKLSGNTSGTVTINTAAAAGTYTLTLPTSDGDSGQYLKTDGSGALSWGTPAGGGGGTKTLAVFTPLDNQPTSTNFATLDTRNSIATLDFDAATAEGAVFVGVIPQGATLTSGIKVRIFWAATSATSGDCVWSAEFEKYGTDIDSDSFDTATTATTTTSGTSGIVVLTEITATAIDSLAAGDQFRVRIKRDAANAADTMTGDAELIAVEVQQVA